MSELLFQISRVGLDGEGVFSVDGYVDHFDSPFFLGDGETTFSFATSEGTNTLSLIGEVVGTATPPFGEAYDPEVIIHISLDGSVFLIGEGAGSYADNESILILSWQFGAGAKYGPQDDVGGGGGGGGTAYIHSQASALTVWTVSHGLGFRPDVAITSVGGIEVHGEVLHVSNSVLTITFDIPFSGFARCT